MLLLRSSLRQENPKNERKNLILYIFRSDIQMSESTGGLLDLTNSATIRQCASYFYLKAICKRENEHQSRVIIWPLTKDFWRWNEFMIPARQPLSLPLPLLVKNYLTENDLFHSLWTFEWNRQVQLSSSVQRKGFVP